MSRTPSRRQVTILGKISAAVSVGTFWRRPQTVGAVTELSKDFSNFESVTLNLTVGVRVRYAGIRGKSVKSGSGSARDN